MTGQNVQQFEMVSVVDFNKASPSFPVRTLFSSHYRLNTCRVDDLDFFLASESDFISFCDDGLRLASSSLVRLPSTPLSAEQQDTSRSQRLKECPHAFVFLARRSTSGQSLFGSFPSRRPLASLPSTTMSKNVSTNVVVMLRIRYLLIGPTISGGP
jgi:hypothetical protein